MININSHDTTHISTSSYLLEEWKLDGEEQSRLFPRPRTTTIDPEERVEIPLSFIEFLSFNLGRVDCGLTRFEDNEEEEIGDSSWELTLVYRWEGLGLPSRISEV